MANSKYEYVKSFELEDEIMLPNIVVVCIDGLDLGRFSEVHEFLKPNEKRALELMNGCAEAVLEQFPDIIFSYGFNNEYSFVFKKETKFYQRRDSKIFSLVHSYFSSIYVSKWKEFFPCMEMRYFPSFKSRVICCASMEVLQAYLAWRQLECHLSNQYNTFPWELIRHGKSEKEGQEMQKGTQKQEENDLLYQKLKINDKEQEAIFRQGTCIFKTEVQHIVKYKQDGSPVKRQRMEAIKVHAKNIASRSFWNDYLCLCRELGQFKEDVNIIKPEYIKSFLHGKRLMPLTWIVIRIDGCHFHRFSDIHHFEKPNDARALNLMNSCAVSVLEKFEDIVFSYGVSDEYSFVLKKESKLYQRRTSEIVSSIVNLFSSTYTKKWKEFFPHKELKQEPYFDGRAVCYPTTETLLDYLAWRQVDCHINNQYNTCFWMLVKSGKTKSEAQNYLKGTRSQEKNELLTRLSGISDYYNTLPPMFRQGSSVFWDKQEDEKMANQEENGKCYKIVVEHCNIIEKSFWEEHPHILAEKFTCCRQVYYLEDQIMLPNIIVVHIDGLDFGRFSEVHEFLKPNDKRALDLMNGCAEAVLEQFPDIIFSYGFNHEYSFVFKKETKFYERRASEILSLINSYFSSIYITKWKEFFPHMEMRCCPSFKSQVISCASMEVLQAYLAWRQRECHLSNQYNTCLWQLIRDGKSEKEAQEMLKGTQKQEKNDLLYQRFNINYKEQETIFRQGTCILKTQVQQTVKYKQDGSPVQRLRMKAIKVHAKNIASRSFWNDYSCLCRELGQFEEDVKKIEPEYVKSFLHGSKLMPLTWIVIHIDGCHFHRFSDVHEFEMPNDARALNLMNACAVGVLEKYKDIVFSYGVSDEYSFVLKKESQLYQRRASDIVSAVVSLFSSTYTKKWKEFFPDKELKQQPYFHGRAVCYPTTEILLDYLAGRQVDGHNSNQYNSCFWMLVKSGKSETEAQNYLKGTQSQEKNELLTRLSGISDYYNTLLPIFRQGSSVFWDKQEDDKMVNQVKEVDGKCCKVVVEHCNIIEESFWEAHAHILGEKLGFCRRQGYGFSLDSHHITRCATSCGCKVAKFSRCGNASGSDQLATNRL